MAERKDQHDAEKFCSEGDTHFVMESGKAQKQECSSRFDQEMRKPRKKHPISFSSTKTSLRNKEHSSESPSDELQSVPSSTFKKNRTFVNRNNNLSSVNRNGNQRSTRKTNWRERPEQYKEQSSESPSGELLNARGQSAPSSTFKKNRTFVNRNSDQSSVNENGNQRSTRKTNWRERPEQYKEKSLEMAASATVTAQSEGANKLGAVSDSVHLVGDQPKASGFNVYAKPFEPATIKTMKNSNLTKLGKVKKKSDRRKQQLSNELLYQKDSFKNSMEGVERCNMNAAVSPNQPKHPNESDDTSSASVKPKTMLNKHSKKTGVNEKKNRAGSSQMRTEHSTNAMSASQDVRLGLKENEPAIGDTACTSDCGEVNARRAGQIGVAQEKFKRYINLPTQTSAAESRLVARTVESHRAALIECLRDASYECMICCCPIKQEVATWNCGKCFHVFHLRCAKRWANTSIVQAPDKRIWRCPACQEEYTQVPNLYVCFCEKLRDPPWNRNDTPHSCGEVCGRQRNEFCTHLCNELCHPGPCPPCHASVSRHCNCKRSYQTVRCMKQSDVHCEQVCKKLLNCRKHMCTNVCHSGACDECTIIVEQACHCRSETRSVICGSVDDKAGSYSCGRPCEKTQSCGNHKCLRSCHPNNCILCSRDPKVITRCPCGAKSLQELTPLIRKSCLEPIPTCGNVCNKVLPCSSLKNQHRCKQLCHEGECGHCDQTTKITCSCGYKTETLSCVEAAKYKNSPYLCGKRCQKKRSCGRHKCGKPCCVDEEHLCMQICDKPLACGNHKCKELCHLGKCSNCWNVSFDELTCYCGTEVIYPPVACGTEPPHCQQQCTRLHDCDHVVQHFCHTERECPPCVVLTTKSCVGGHEMRNNIPCHFKNIICGKPCLKKLRCGEHLCQKTCHKGDCEDAADLCHQTCKKLRVKCGHPCGVKCHSGSDCPDSDCQTKVTLNCPCGNRKAQVYCYATNEGNKLSAAALSLKMQDTGSRIDVSELLNKDGSKMLDCDEKCALLERNRRLASALSLEIVDSETLHSLEVLQYSDFLKRFARKNARLVGKVETALCELVQSVLNSKHRQRSHHFDRMNREQRQLIHELAEHYGCETESFDEEPHRNVVAFAKKSICKLPRQTLTSTVQAENHPKAPLPIPLNATVDQLRAKQQEERLNTTVAKPANEIDYFEMT